jgi:hypothetical protein
MRGYFWNIRDLNHPSRKSSLESLIRNNSLDFVGVVETKKEAFQQGFLECLDGPSKFSWHALPAVGTTGVSC